MPLTPEQRIAVVNEAGTWVNTPYRGWACIKGKLGGTDCGQLIKGVFQRTGHLPAGDLGIRNDYNLQVNIHEDSPDYMNHVLRFCREIPIEEVQMGDLVVYKMGHAYAHGGIVVDWDAHRIIHCVAKGGVRVSENYTHPKLRGSLLKFFTLRDEYCEVKK
jgi:cell wall-associated NlpC family hydrolase